MVIKLLPKPDGTHRPIVLFRSVYRVHGRLLGRIVKEWEKGESSKLPFGNNGHCETLDSTYRCCVRQAIGLISGISPHTAVVMIDLSKCH